MPIIAKKKKQDYETAPEGLHSAVCCDVIDKGMVKGQYGEAWKIQIRWELEELDSRGKRFMAVNSYTNSLHEKSRLRPMLEAWRGKKFSEDELDGFDLEKLVGANCQVQIIHQPKTDGSVGAFIQAVVPAARNATRLRVSDDYVRFIDRPENQNQHTASADEFNQAPQISDEDIPF
jgi:hypothetical protein